MEDIGVADLPEAAVVRKWDHSLLARQPLWRRGSQRADRLFAREAPVATREAPTAGCEAPRAKHRRRDFVVLVLGASRDVNCCQ
jgi:hypothetical protein